MAIFPNDGVKGAIVAGQGYEPSAKGAVVYFNGGEDLNQPLSKVERAGGKVLMPKTFINEQIGFCARVLDSEGNLVALHSRK